MAETKENVTIKEVVPPTINENGVEGKNNLDKNLIKTLLDDVFGDERFGEYLKRKGNQDRLDGYKKDFLEAVTDIEEGIDKIDTAQFILSHLENVKPQPKKVISILNQIVEEDSLKEKSQGVDTAVAEKETDQTQNKNEGVDGVILKAIHDKKFAQNLANHEMQKMNNSNNKDIRDALIEDTKKFIDSSASFIGNFYSKLEDFKKKYPDSSDFQRNLEKIIESYKEKVEGFRSKKEYTQANFVKLNQLHYEMQEWSDKDWIALYESNVLKKYKKDPASDEEKVKKVSIKPKKIRNTKDKKDITNAQGQPIIEKQIDEGEIEKRTERIVEIANVFKDFPEELRESGDWNGYNEKEKNTIILILTKVEIRKTLREMKTFADEIIDENVLKIVSIINKK